MPYNPSMHHRRSGRLNGYHYTQPGIYFVTICTYDRLCLFNEPRLRGLAETQWRTLPDRFAAINLDEWVIMPNHVHGLIEMIGTPPGSQRPGRTQPGNTTTNTGLGIHAAAGTLGAIVRAYKAEVTRRASAAQSIYRSNLAAWVLGTRHPRRT